MSLSDVQVICIVSCFPNSFVSLERGCVWVAGKTAVEGASSFKRILCPCDFDRRTNASNGKRAR